MKYFEKISGVQAQFYKEMKPALLELLNARKLKELAPGKRDAKILETMDDILRKYKGNKKSIKGIFGFGLKSETKQIPIPKNFALNNLSKQWARRYETK